MTLKNALKYAAPLLIGAAMLAQAGPAQAQATKLKFSTMESPSDPFVGCFTMPLLNELKAATGGRIDFETYMGGTAFAHPLKQYEQVAQGVMDISQGVLSYTPGQFALTEVLTMPFLVDDARKASIAVNKLAPSLLARRVQGHPPDGRAGHAAALRPYAWRRQEPGRSQGQAGSRHRRWRDQSAQGARCHTGRDAGAGGLRKSAKGCGRWRTCRIYRAAGLPHRRGHQDPPARQCQLGASVHRHEQGEACLAAEGHPGHRAHEILRPRHRRAGCDVLAETRPAGRGQAQVRRACLRRFHAGRPRQGGAGREIGDRRLHCRPSKPRARRAATSTTRCRRKCLWSASPETDGNAGAETLR